VALLRGGGRGARERQREARARALAEQSERIRRTGFAGGHAELGHAVAFELRARGYSASIAAFGGNLCAVGGTWNFQGNPRLAQLIGRSVRSAQRYRAQLEADGLLRSYCLEPGDMIDGQRAPVLRPQVVRDLSKLRALALARLAQRPRKSPRQRAKQNARAAAVVAPPRAAPVTAEQLQDVAARAPEWLRGAFLGGRAWTEAGSSKRRSGPAPQSSGGEVPCSPEPTESVAPLSPEELDALDAELRELTEQLERGPPPD
jgi:hypothetical protein